MPSLFAKLFCTLFTVLAFDAIAPIVPTGTLSVNLYDSLSGKPTAARVRITRNNLRGKDTSHRCT